MNVDLIKLRHDAHMTVEHHIAEARSQPAVRGEQRTAQIADIAKKDPERAMRIREADEVRVRWRILWTETVLVARDALLEGNVARAREALAGNTDDEKTSVVLGLLIAQTLPMRVLGEDDPIVARIAHLSPRLHSKQHPSRQRRWYDGDAWCGCSEEAINPDCAEPHFTNGAQGPHVKPRTSGK